MARMVNLPNNPTNVWGASQPPTHLLFLCHTKGYSSLSGHHRGTMKNSLFHIFVVVWGVCGVALRALYTSNFIYKENIMFTKIYAVVIAIAIAVTLTGCDKAERQYKVQVQIIENMHSKRVKRIHKVYEYRLSQVRDKSLVRNSLKTGPRMIPRKPSQQSAEYKAIMKERDETINAAEKERNQQLKKAWEKYRDSLNHNKRHNM